MTDPVELRRRLLALADEMRRKANAHPRHRFRCLRYARNLERRADVIVEDYGRAVAHGVAL